MKRKKPVGGRPKTLAPDMDRRIMIRCTSEDEVTWTEHAQALGLKLSAWIRMRLKEQKS